MDFLLVILSHIPLWVWAILGYIVFMGVKQLREQRLHRARLLLLPGVWLVFGAWGVTRSFGLEAAPLLAWALGLGASILSVRALHWPAQARFDASTRRFVVPGSVLPLLLMLGIFCAKFALGMSLAMHPTLAQALPAAIGFSLVFGLLSGTLLGRSLTILGRAQ